MLAAGIDHGGKDLPDLEKKLRLRRGTAGPQGQRNAGYRSPARRVRNRVAEAGLPFQRQDVPIPSRSGEAYPVRPATVTELDLQRLMIRGEFIRPLSGRSVVFLGRLNRITSQQAQSLTERLGGSYQQAITETTDLVVVGSPSAKTKFQKEREFENLESDSDGRSQPNSEAADRQFRVMDEDEFLGLVIAR
jgi:DNA polymerase-3 subunit epsilon